MQMSLAGRYEERGATVVRFSAKLKLIEPLSDVVWECSVGTASAGCNEGDD